MAEQQSSGTRAEGDTRPFRDVIQASESFSLPEASGGAMVEFVGRVQRWEQGRFVLLLPPHDDLGVLAVELDVGDVHEAEPIFEDSAGRSSYRVLVPSGSLVKLVFRAPDLVARLVAQRDRPEMPEPLAPWRVDLGRRDPDPYAPAGTGPRQQRPYGRPAAPPAHQQQPYSTLPGLQQDAGYYPEPVPGQRARYGPAERDPALYQPYQAGHDPAYYQHYEAGPYAQPGYGTHPAQAEPGSYDPAHYQHYEAGPYVQPGYGTHPAQVEPGPYDPAHNQHYEAVPYAQPGYGTHPAQVEPGSYDPAHYQHYEAGPYAQPGYGTHPAQYRNYEAGTHGHGTPGQYDQYPASEYGPTYPDQHDPYR